MLTLKRNGHAIEQNQVVRVIQWDQEVKGYIGTVEYTANGKGYMPYITKSELQSLQNMGFVPQKIQAIKYSGTY